MALVGIRNQGNGASFCSCPHCLTSIFRWPRNSVANVLFIAVDDLNHWVGHLDGHPGTRTPNIDRLASEGVTFSRAYAAAPLCNPSRVSLLTGVMPARSGVYGNFEELREQLPDAVTLPQYFRRHGYSVKGGGKIFHMPGCRGMRTPGTSILQGGNRLKRKPRREKEVFASKRRQANSPKKACGPPGDHWMPMTAKWPMPRMPIASLPSSKSQHDKPFFLAYGTYQPHLALGGSEAVFRDAPPGISRVAEGSTTMTSTIFHPSVASSPPRCWTFRMTETMRRPGAITRTS